MAHNAKVKCYDNAIKKVIDGAYNTGSPNWTLVKNYMPLLKSIVSKMLIHFPSTVEREDICTIGLIGLIAASKGASDDTKTFGSYATIKIKGAILDELRRIDWLPRAVRTKVKEFLQKLKDLEQKLGRAATDDEICKNLHLSKSEYLDLRDKSQKVVYMPLDVGVGNDGDGEERNSLQDILEDISQENGREVFERKELMLVVKDCIKELPQTSQKVFALYYAEGLLLSEIASVFSVSESRICQIHSEAINLLRKKVISKLSK